MVYQGRRAGPGAFNNAPANTAFPGSGGESLTEFMYPMKRSLPRLQRASCRARFLRWLKGHKPSPPDTRQDG